MCRVFLCVFACILPLFTAAQSCECNVKVSIVEAHNFEPVYPALVYVEPSGVSYETDPGGNILLRHFCPGRYVLRFQASGYVAQVDTIDVSGNQSIKIKAKLLEHSLREVSIREERQHTVRQVKEQMTSGDIKAASGKGLAEMLQAVNGVTILSNGATIAKPVIHGLHSNRIVMVNNGVKQEDQQWGGEHAPNIDPAMAGKITVVKGAAGVRYGTDAIGGVVLVEPAPLRSKPGWDGDVNLSAFSNNRMGVMSGMVEHCLKSLPALSFRLQGSLKQGGNYRVPGYWVANTGVKEADFSATIGYRKLHYGTEIYYSRFATDLGVYRGSHTGNQADLDNAINSDHPLVPAEFTYDLARPRQHVVHDLAKASFYADTRLGMWHVDYGYQHNFRQEYDVLRTENGKAQLNLTLNTQTLSAHIDHKAVAGVEGQAGIDGTYQSNYFKNGDRLFIPSYQMAGGGLYVIERYKRNDWELEGGARYDYKWYGVSNPEGSDQHLVYYDLNYGNVSATMGAHKQQRSNLEWQVIFSSAWRPPQANELFSAGLHHGAARVELGNKTLVSERSYSGNAEIKYQPVKKVMLDVSVYSQLIDDYIYLEPGPDLLTIRGYFKTFNFRQTNAWLNGLDATAGYAVTEHLQAGFKASFLRARDRSRNEWLILMPSDRLSASVRYTRSLSQRFRNCYAEINSRYVNRQTRIPSYFDQIDYPRPPAEYFLLGAEAGADLILSSQTMHISLAVSNILNERYRDYLDVFRYFLDQPGTNAVLRLSIPINHS